MALPFFLKASVVDVSNAKYLAHLAQTQKNTSHHMFYMCHIFTICDHTVANLQWYRHKCQIEK